MLKLKINNNLETTFKILFALIILLIATGCSKLQTDIPSAPPITIHKEGITNPNSSNFHGNLVRLNGWDMNTCMHCHASDYSGGIAETSCLNCHTNTGGPEACNTCHGDFNNITRIAPPKDLNKDTLTTSAGVGAHVKHLYDNQLGSEILCSTCHKVPQEVYDPGHVDSDLPAEVIFSELAIRNLGINSSYDYANISCSETYCHGNWEFLKDSSSFPVFYTADKMTGNNVSIIWNQVDGTQALCGSCHNLPPDGHQEAQLSGCGTCHSGIVDTNGEIVDSLRYKHMNGEKNVFGN